MWKDQMASESNHEFFQYDNNVRQIKTPIRKSQRSPTRQVRPASPVKRVGDGYHSPYQNPDYLPNANCQPMYNRGRESGHTRDITYYSRDDNEVEPYSSRAGPLYSQQPAEEITDDQIYYPRDNDLYNYASVTAKPVKRSGLNRRTDYYNIGDNTPDNADRFHYEGADHVKAYADNGGYYYIQGSENHYDGEGEGYYKQDYYEGNDNYPEIAGDEEEVYDEYDYYDNAVLEKQALPSCRPTGNRNSYPNSSPAGYDPYQDTYTPKQHHIEQPQMVDQNNNKRSEIYRDIMKKLNETATELKNARVEEPLHSSAPNLDYIQRYNRNQIRGGSEQLHPKTESNKIEEDFPQSLCPTDQVPKTFLQKVQESATRSTQNNLNYNA